jgi:hypothetical protein
MATGYTQTELDDLLDAMDSLVPPVPTVTDRARAGRVAAMRAAGTEKGLLLNIEAKQGEVEIFWLNCCVAKEFLSAIDCVSHQHGWVKRRITPLSSDHLKAPKIQDLTGAASVRSFSTYGAPGGIVACFAVARETPTTLFFPKNAALEIMNYVVRNGAEATWWDDKFALIPSGDSQR